LERWLQPDYFLTTYAKRPEGILEEPSSSPQTCGTMKNSSQIIFKKLCDSASVWQRKGLLLD